MRFPSSIIAFVLGLVALGIGIGQLTVWAPEETQTAHSDAVEEAPLTIITDGIIDPEEEREDFTIEAEGEYTVALARIDDIEAWVDDAAHNRITEIGESAEGPEIVTEHVEGETEVPDPSASDLWAAAESADGPMNYPWVAPDPSGDWALLLFVDGEEPAPTEVSAEVQETPDHTVGIVLIVVGALLILLALALFYRALGSRRKEKDLVSVAYDSKSEPEETAAQTSSAGVSSAGAPAAGATAAAEDQPTAEHGSVPPQDVEEAQEDDRTTLIGRVTEDDGEQTTAMPAVEEPPEDHDTGVQPSVDEEQNAGGQGAEKQRSAKDDRADEGLVEEDSAAEGRDAQDSAGSGTPQEGTADEGEPRRWWKNGSVATVAAVAVALSPAAGLSGSVVVPFDQQEENSPSDEGEGNGEDAEQDEEEAPETTEQDEDDDPEDDDEEGPDAEDPEGEDSEEESTEEEPAEEQEAEEQPEAPQPEQEETPDDRDRDIEVEGEMPSEGYSVLLESQLERILGDIAEVVEEGDAELDAELLTDRVAGNALESRELAYRNNELADSSLPAPIGTEVLASAVTSETEFPRQAVVITQHDDAEIPTILVIEQEAARENYRLVEAAPMVPGTEFPSISAEQGGIEPLPLDAEGARTTPAESIEGMAGLFSDAEHEFGDVVGDSIFIEDLHDYYSSLEEAAADTEISMGDPDVREDVYALQLPDGSVVAAGSFDMNVQMSPNEPGDTIFLDDDLVAELAETTWTTFPTTITNRETVVVHIPADDSEEIVLIGVHDMVADASVEAPDWFDGY